MGGSPAYVINPRGDIVGWNQARNHVIPGFDTLIIRERNILRSLFPNPLLRTELRDWDKEAKATLALFRANSDRYVREPWFKALVAELQQTRPAFREWWSQHDIQAVWMRHKELNHPLVGELVFQSNTFQVVDAPDLHMVIFTAADAETARKLIQLADPSKSTRIDAHGGKSTFLIPVSN